FTGFGSCFAGTIFEVARAAPPPQVTRVTTQPVRQFLTAGDAGQTVSDDGTFARLFVEALQGQRRADGNGDGYLTASELGAFLDARMSNYSNNKQTPRYGKLNHPDWDRGDFVFQLASVAPKRKVKGTGGGSADKETVFWQSIEASRRAADFKDYLARFPNGTFTGIAKRRIEELEQKTASLSPPSFTVEGLDETLVALRSANVRELPTASSGKAGTLASGATIEVTGKIRFEGKDWYRVAYSGRAAYVFGSLLGNKATPVVASSPKASPPPKATPVVGVYPSLTPGKTFRDCPECPEMVVIPSGSFRMGDLSGGGKDAEKPVREVRIGYSFAVGKYEVTQDEWVAVMGSNPSRFKGARNPVDKVSWKDAKAYVGKLSAKTGKEYRLLSESEWEYMARAGSTSKYPWGDGIDASKAKYGGIPSGTVAVGSYGANSFGVHDTVGNVSEWVEDCWNRGYRGAPSDGSVWTSGDCSQRVVRGGSWGASPRYERSAKRDGIYTTHGDFSLGFRVARTLSR
ncbi:MAG: SUMF1/EgtB/PvdO family nonheme iron enzyme, partial [Rhodospirillaceae bacterium]|nr:SUMF1/EgtB/PvdO family nonheme iron enzyme [Rhodospirillaceae bacterium]